ncbi:MAG: retroviral-like aspartic protease family protein [Flavobacteriaceae bacterium]|nr:retroviral-like aspartic protease family protein [Flavobacteriaceae bacterium]
MKLKYLVIILFFIIACKHPYSNEIKGGYGATEKRSVSVIKDDYEILKMRTEGGVKYVKIEINEMPLEFIFDTGASDICISLREAKELYRQGTLTKSDFLGVERYQDATGKISKGMKINLKKVKIGNIILRNVEANIVDNYKAPLLLGQSALEQFGTIEIDNDNQVIMLRR